MAFFYTGGRAVLVLALGCGGSGASPVDAGGGGSPGGGGGGSLVAGSGGSSVAGTGGSIATGGVGGGAGALSAAIVLAADEDSPTTLAIDATDVYWNTSGAIRRVPKTGGPVTTVYASVPGYELAVDDGYVFWFQGSATAFKDLVRAPKGGGGARTTIATLTESGGGLVIDADAVYWIQSDGPNAVLMRLPKAGGVAPTPLVSHLARTCRVAAHCLIGIRWRPGQGLALAFEVLADAQVAGETVEVWEKGELAQRERGHQRLRSATSWSARFTSAVLRA